MFFPISHSLCPFVFHSLCPIVFLMLRLSVHLQYWKVNDTGMLEFLHSTPLHSTPPHPIDTNVCRLCCSHLYLWCKFVSFVSSRRPFCNAVSPAGNAVIWRPSLREKSFLRTRIWSHLVHQWYKVRSPESRISLRAVYFIYFPQPLESQKPHKWFRMVFEGPHTYG